MIFFLIRSKLLTYQLVNPVKWVFFFLIGPKTSNVQVSEAC